MSQDSNIAPTISYNVVPFEHHTLRKDDKGLYSFSGYIPLVCNDLKEKYSRTDLTDKQMKMLDKVKNVRQNIIEQTALLNEAIGFHNHHTNCNNMDRVIIFDRVIKRKFKYILMICDLELPTAWCNYYDSLNE